MTEIALYGLLFGIVLWAGVIGVRLLFAAHDDEMRRQRSDRVVRFEDYTRLDRW